MAVKKPNTIVLSPQELEDLKKLEEYIDKQINQDVNAPKVWIDCVIMLVKTNVKATSRLIHALVVLYAAAGWIVKEDQSVIAGDWIELS